MVAPRRTRHVETMMLDSALFYLFATLIVGASLLVIVQTNVMYSVMLLIASFGALAGLYVLLEAPFAAVIQIIVYAGAIMVLFLFVVMLLNVGREEAPPTQRAPARRFGAVLAAGFAIELAWGVWRSTAGPPSRMPVVRSVRDIGLSLFTDYAFAFEVTAVLTLVAMLGAVVLTRRGSSHVGPES